MSDIRAILTDIEGTTSSIAFVKDVLFPFSLRRLPAFVAMKAGEAEVRRLLDDARSLAGRPELDEAGLVGLLCEWIEKDSKATPLKALQGLIWAEGYKDGSLVGHVYADAVEGLRAWHRAGLSLNVYSSGSVAAQKLIFGHTAFGDLTPLFSRYFDTATGPKKESSSYAAIARALALPPPAILFLSDDVRELDAARRAGFRTVCLERGEPGSAAGRDHPVVRSFAEIDPCRIP